MHPRTLLGVLDHIMRVEADSNASVSFARQKDMEERSLKRRARSEVDMQEQEQECAALDPLVPH
eukprot:scaffold2678_cov123-Skeletonema_dohrnii-CCMP3373.AAC.7